MQMFLWLGLIILVCAMPQPSPNLSVTELFESSFAIQLEAGSSSDHFYRQYISMTYFKNSPTCSKGNAVYSVTQSDYHLCRPTSTNTVTPNGAIANSFTMLISPDCKQYRAVYYQNEICTGAEAWTDPVTRELELDNWSTSCEAVDDLADPSFTRMLTCGSSKMGPEILKKTEYFTNKVYGDGNLDCAGDPIRETNYVANDCIVIGTDSSMKWTRDGETVYRTEYKGDSTCDSAKSHSDVQIIVEMENSIGACTGKSSHLGNLGDIPQREVGTYTAPLSSVLFQEGIIRSTTVTINASQKIIGSGVKEIISRPEVFKEVIGGIVGGGTNLTVMINSAREQNSGSRSLRSRSFHSDLFTYGSLNAYSTATDVGTVPGYDVNPFVLIDFSIVVDVPVDVTVESEVAAVKWRLARATVDEGGAVFTTAFIAVASRLLDKALVKKMEIAKVAPASVSDTYSIETIDTKNDAGSNPEVDTTNGRNEKNDEIQFSRGSLNRRVLHMLGFNTWLLTYVNISVVPLSIALAILLYLIMGMGAILKQESASKPLKERRRPQPPAELSPEVNHAFAIDITYTLNEMGVLKLNNEYSDGVIGSAEYYSAEADAFGDDVDRLDVLRHLRTLT